MHLHLLVKVRGRRQTLQPIKAKGLKWPLNILTWVVKKTKLREKQQDPWLLWTKCGCWSKLFTDRGTSCSETRCWLETPGCVTVVCAQNMYYVQLHTRTHTLATRTCMGGCGTPGTLARHVFGLCMSVEKYISEKLLFKRRLMVDNKVE